METKKNPKNNRIDHKNRESLKHALKKLPELNPPANFVHNVMSQVKPHNVTILDRLKHIFSRQVTVSFVPLKWVPALTCAFLLFIILYQSPDQRPVQPIINELAELSYIMGRSELAKNDPQKALPYLKAAIYQDRTQADYHFWLGVAYWATGNYQLEKESYAAALQLNPNFLPAHVYMGHSYMEKKQWSDAIYHYKKVLSQVPDHAESLFNSGIVYRKLGMRSEENAAWTQYLSYTNNGPKTIDAVNYLNSNGVFSMQTAYIGEQKRVLKSVEYRGNSIEPLSESLPTLVQVGKIIKDKPDLLLHIIVYENNDKDLARKRAQYLKKYMLKIYPDIETNGIRTSWFEVPRTMQFNRKQFFLDSSVQLFAETMIKS